MRESFTVSGIWVQLNGKSIGACVNSGEARSIAKSANAALDKHDDELLGEVVRLLASVYFGFGKSLLGGSPADVDAASDSSSRKSKSQRPRRGSAKAAGVCAGCF